jgi:hypothetical protein
MTAADPNDQLATHTETAVEEQTQKALAALNAEELLLLSRNADQFRHYINKKAKRLKREAKQKTSITSEGAPQS